MKKSEEKQLKGLLERMPEDSSMVFKYGVNKNLSALKTANKELDKTEKQAREVLKDYDSEVEKGRNELIMKLGEDDGIGGKIIKPDSKNWDEWIKSRDKLTEKLDKKFAKEIEAYNKKIEEMKPIYEDDSTFVPYHIKLDVCPDLPRKTLEYLMDIGIIE